MTFRPPCKPQGYQLDLGELWCAIATCPTGGRIPGKVTSDGVCYYAF